MTDAVTQWVNLPLPDPAHALEYDVLRLIAALTSIDGLLHLLEEVTTSDDPGGLGRVQALVEAVRALQSALTAAQTDLVQLVPAAGGSFVYAEDGTISSITEVLPGSVARTTTYTYTDGALTTATTTVGGHTYRTTYTYTAGVLTGMLREVL
jgi:hypothetical protein